MPRSPKSIYHYIVAVGLLAAAPFSIHADDFSKWEKDIAKFEEQDRIAPPPKNAVLFVGSSSIRKWTTLATDFPEHRVINRGFGGSQLPDSIHFADRIIIPHAPRMIVVYAGANDIDAGATPERVLSDFKKLVATVREKLPSVPIVFISIAGNPARWRQVERVKAANALVAQYSSETPGIIFVDVFSAMLGPDGLPNPDLFVDDRLHMNANGYAIWTRTIAPLLPAPDRQESRVLAPLAQ